MLSDSGDRWHSRYQHPVILFDGVCNLCNSWVRFVVRHDPAGIFRFAAQQSAIGQVMIEEQFSSSPQLSSVILIMGDNVYTESTAVLEICARLASPWSWIAHIVRIIPRRLRDFCYRFVVRHRYRWFGRTEMCQMPSAEMRSRFIG
jgi:predicted DCC family thiol-disulfide oxidoreductase YuxK